MPLTITLNGSNGDVSLRMNLGIIQYFDTTLSTWTNINISDWPVTFTNSNPGASSVLRVVFSQDLTINTGYGNTLGYFIAGSPYITFDGSNNFIIINSITSYPGFIQNGSTATSTNGYANVIVQNIKTNVTGTSTLNGAVSGSRAGWICAGSFGRGALANQIINCTNNGAITASCGGICGDRLGTLGGSVTITNCTNSGTIGNSGGGIASLTAGAFSGSATFVNCTNTGLISGSTAGGISGPSAGASGSVTFTGCANSGTISGNNAGGISGSAAGGNVGVGAGSATFTNCSNTGNITSGTGQGGIVGGNAGQSGSATITSCTNSGTIGGNNAGGIAGSSAGNSTGSATFTNCTNTGIIGGIEAGGIIGGNAGQSNGLVTLTNCFSTGAINGQFSGGITGDWFGYDTSRNCVISQCYSTGNIGGNNAGGIVGAEVGYTSNASIIPNVNITDCYSLGVILSTGGGICGGTKSSIYAVNPNVSITNCYSYGQISTANSGIVAVGLLIPITKTNTYVANNIWSDASANSNLTGTPTNISTNNPGSTWTMITAGTPYVLSAYNAALYSPSSASSSNNYTSAAGLFSPGYTYRLLYTSQAGNVATARVFASKGTAPYYNSYNSNTFTLTYTNSGSGAITATINNASTGVLDFIVPPPYPCFLEGTKILCFENNQEVYRPIESLRKGDLVKTIYNGYMPINIIGTTSIYNPGNDYRVVNRLYKCSREKYPTLFEDLYITGCHSILVPEMTDDQWENTKAANGDVFVTDNHFRLVACADEKAEPFNKEGFMNIYHIALEHHDVLMNYGIYANGLLVESCSERNLRYLSNMRILGEEDCSVSENVDKMLIRQLVDTY